MTGLARWCYRNRWIVVGVWLGVLILTSAVAAVTGNKYRDDFNLPGTDTQRAFDLLTAEFPQQAGDFDQIVIHTRTGKVTDPEVKRAEEAMLQNVRALPHIVAMSSPYSPAGAFQISRDQRTAFATIEFDTLANAIPKSAIQKVIDTAETGSSGRVQVALGGQGIEYIKQPSTLVSEIAGGLAAAVILFLAFGSWRGMVLPLVTAVVALGIAAAVIGIVSNVMSVAKFTEQLAALMGLGVGVDYALFIVSRHRNNLMHGMDVEESVIASVDTSGRAVVFAGAAVSFALLGLMLLGISFLVGVSLGAVMTVILTMLASLTLLPAMLSFMGRKILGRKLLRQLESSGPTGSHVSGGWLTWARRVERRPLLLAVVAFLVIVFVGLPAFTMRLGSSDAGNDPKGWTTRQAYDLLSDGFAPGFNGPLIVAASLDGAGDNAADLAKLHDAIRSTPGVLAVTDPIPSQNGQAATMTAITYNAPQDAETYSLVHKLRSTVIPRAIAGSSVKTAYIGGSTAAFVDFSHVLSTKLPLFVGVVVLAAFLLLMVAFRSLVIPLTASIMNILAALASFGLMVFVFQQGHLGSIFAVGRPGPIDSFIPVMLFAILFGLSMDYQVFLVSRMHEEWIHTKDNSRSVIVGQTETGRVITAAAGIMMVVFLAFVFTGQRQVGEFGLGLFGAVLLDAYVLRTVLVPAAMHAFGDANWWLPGWLDRILPHVSIDPPSSTDHVEVILDDE
ncbi:MAG: MMPL family transporter [Frankiaceae bacterium]|nr:MMPL family transporter [Frankiaceae bacterium]MBV9872714.1 MMPL family transporter [Frankiaceae bacterium]